MRKSPLRSVRALLFFASFLLTGCYDRWTGNYDKVPELETEERGILETSGPSPEDIKKQEEELRKYAEMATPPPQLPRMAVSCGITPEAWIFFI